MGDFYKKIKESIDNIPESKASQGDWTSFQSFRSQKDDAPRKPFPWLFASTVGLIALLLGTNIYWATRTTENTPLVSSSIVHDTIYITKVIDNSNSEAKNIIASLESDLAKATLALNHQSTSYNYLQSQYSIQNGLVRSMEERLSNQEMELGFFKRADRINVDNAFNLSASLQGDVGANDRDRTEMEFFDLPSLTLGNLHYQRSKLVHPSNIIWIKNEKPFNLLNALVPKSLSLNLNGGLHQSMSEQYGNGSGHVLELRATTIFTKHVRGYLGVSSFDSGSEIEDDLNYPNVPSITIPEGEELKEIKVANSILSLSLGLEYLFYTNSKFRPHIGLGYAQSIINEDKFSFELESPNGEYNISPEHGVNQNQIRQILFSLGTDYNLSSNIDLRSAVSYSKSLMPNRPSFINVTGGIYYHF